MNYHHAVHAEPLEYQEYVDEQGKVHHEEVAAIVERGKQIGYEVHDVVEYDTRGGHVTVEEDYQEVYAADGGKDIKYTVIETTEEVIDTRLSDKRDRFEEGGIRYSSSSGGSGYRNY